MPHVLQRMAWGRDCSRHDITGVQALQVPTTGDLKPLKHPTKDMGEGIYAEYDLHILTALDKIYWGPFEDACAPKVNLHHSCLQFSHELTLKLCVVGVCSSAASRAKEERCTTSFCHGGKPEKLS